MSNVTNNIASFEGPEHRADDPGLGQLLDKHRERLKRMVHVRMDPRLHGRFDASDVIQEAFMEATVRIDQYRRDLSVPFYVWLRFLVGQKLLAFCRLHLGAQRRDVSRQVPLGEALPWASSECIALQLMGRTTSPSQFLVKEEQRNRLMAMLDKMEPIDREVLTLRHFEQLDNVEAAAVLEINPSAASNRYVRALKRLREALSHMPGFLDEA